MTLSALPSTPESPSTPTDGGASLSSAPDTTPAAEASTPTPISKPDATASMVAIAEALNGKEDGQGIDMTPTPAADDSKGPDAAAQTADPSRAKDSAGDGSDASANPGAADSAAPGAITADQARVALKRAGFPDDVIDGFAPDRLLELGSKRKKQQDDQAAFGSDAKNLRAQNEDLQARLAALEAGTPQQPVATPPPTALPTPQEGGTTPPAPALDASAVSAIDQALAPLTDGDDADLFGEVAGPVKAAFAALQTANDQKLSATQAAYEQSMAGVYEQLDRFHMERAASALDAKYPGIQDPDTFAKVADRVYLLANSDADGTTYRDATGNPDWASLVSDAAHGVLGKNAPDPVKTAQAQMLTQTRKTVAGQPDVASNTSKISKPVDSTAAMVEIARALSDGQSPDDIARRQAG